MVAVSSPFALLLTLAVAASAAPVGNPRTTPAAVWNVVSTSATKAFLNTPRVKPSTSNIPTPSTSKEYLNTPRVKPSTISVVSSTTTSTTTAPTAAVTNYNGCPAATPFRHIDTPSRHYENQECYCTDLEAPVSFRFATCGVHKSGTMEGLTCATPGYTVSIIWPRMCVPCEDEGVYDKLWAGRRKFEARAECKGVPNQLKPSTAAPTSTKPGYFPPKATTSWSWVTAAPASTSV